MFIKLLSYIVKTFKTFLENNFVWEYLRGIKVVMTEQKRTWFIGNSKSKCKLVYTNKLYKHVGLKETYKSWLFFWTQRIRKNILSYITYLTQ